MAKSAYIERLGHQVVTEAFKKNIRLVRNEAGETDDEFGRHFGVTGGAVRMWESGQSTPTDPRCEDILKFARENEVEITAEFLLTGKGEGPDWSQDNHPRQHKPRIPYRSEASSMADMIPVRLSVDNGDGSITISGEMERSVAPRNLVNREGSFGVFIPNDDMAPVFRYGDIAWVDSSLPPVRDSEVIVEGPDGTAAIGTLVLYTKDKITIEILRPEPHRVELDRAETRVHRIVGKESRR